MIIVLVKIRGHFYNAEKMSLLTTRCKIGNRKVMLCFMSKKERKRLCQKSTETTAVIIAAVCEKIKNV